MKIKWNVTKTVTLSVSLIKHFYFRFPQSFVCRRAAGRRGNQRERVNRRTGRKRREERARDQHVVQQGVNRSFRPMRIPKTGLGQILTFYSPHRTSFQSWIWTTTQTPWVNWDKPSCCSLGRAKRGKRRRSLSHRNRKWPRLHRKWRRLKTTATLMMTAAMMMVMMRGDVYIFVYISAKQNQFRSQKKKTCFFFFFSTGKLRKWNTPRRPSAREERLMRTMTFKLFLWKKQVSSELCSTFDIIRELYLKPSGALL